MSNKTLAVAYKHILRQPSLTLISHKDTLFLSFSITSLCLLIQYNTVGIDGILQGFLSVRYQTRES